MKGTVVLVNPKNRFFAVEVDGGDYAVVEMLGGYDVEVGDVLSGNLHSVAGADLYNETQRETQSVFIQDFHCSHAVAWASLALLLGWSQSLGSEPTCHARPLQQRQCG